MPWRTHHPKRHYPTPATPKQSQLSNYPRYLPRRKIMWRKEQTLHNSKQLKPRHCTSESASRSDQTSSLSTAQCHWRWWGEGIYKFSAQGPHVPISSNNYSPPKSLSHHQGCRLRNLQGWTREGQVPTWDQEAIKIPCHFMHWQHNSKKTMKLMQLPIKYLEWTRNTDIWSKAQRGKFRKDPLQTNWGS